MNWEVPRNIPYTLKRDDDGMAVWALQRCLNSFTDLGFKTAEDGDFGPRTEANVKAYQGMVKLEADGVVGPQTQMRLAQSCVIRVDSTKALPKNLLLAVVRGESGGLIAAVNWSVPGGVDCGFTQRRIPVPYTEAQAKDAFDSRQQIERLRTELTDRFRAFSREDTVRSRSDAAEYAWRLAVGQDQLGVGAVLLDGVEGAQVARDDDQGHIRSSAWLMT
jgi:hypothetical protein